MSDYPERAAQLIRECAKTSEGRVTLVTAYAAIHASAKTLAVSGLQSDERVQKIFHDAAEMLDPTCSRCNSSNGTGDRT